MKTVVRVPTYDGDNFGQPDVPVVVTDEAACVRLILGTDNPDDMEKPDIQVERRRNGWAVFINPQGDTSGVVYILDDGRSMAVPEGSVHRDETMKWRKNPPKEIDEVPKEVDVVLHKGAPA